MENILQRLKQDRRFQNQIEYHKHFPARPAVLEDVNQSLDEGLKSYLSNMNITKLYRHQRQAIDEALAGKNTVIVTSTASGKTLCYNLPVLNTLLQSQNTASIYLFPTKALSRDQLRTLTGMISTIEPGILCGVYDGDTPGEERKQLRQNGRIILTNPDMLHTGILPNHKLWGGFFRNLKFVVIDEIHSLRGIFGSNVANVIRRLRRISEFYGAEPQFICASATINNPKKHAENLTGVKFSVINNDGSPKGEREFLLWNPPLRSKEGIPARKSASSVAVQLLPILLSENIKVINFARARKTTELIIKYLKQSLGNNPATAHMLDKVDSYRGGFLPNERREIERKLAGGQINAVISTNALELGIDIGFLDACIISDYPGSLASLRQQAGRAGRKQKPSLVIFIANDNPVDQYFMRNPEYIFEKEVECAVIEYENIFILAKHILCAAKELPIAAEDKKFFGKLLQEVLKIFMEEGIIQKNDEEYKYLKNDYPAATVKIRTTSEDIYTIYSRDDEKKEEIGTIDEHSAFQTVHEGAVYLHRNETYIVEELDIKNCKAYLRQRDLDYFTDPSSQTEIVEKEIEENEGFHECRKYTGVVVVKKRIEFYKKVKFYTLENVGFGTINLPAVNLETTGFWLAIPDNVISSGSEKYGWDFISSGLDGVKNVLAHLATIFVMCDKSDIGCESLASDQRGEHKIYLYDNYPGGIGYAEKTYERFDEIAPAILEHIKNCPCEYGCPSCVLSGKIKSKTNMPVMAEDGRSKHYREHLSNTAKEGAKWLLHAILGMEKYAPKIKETHIDHLETETEEIDETLRKKIRRAVKNIGKKITYED